MSSVLDVETSARLLLSQKTLADGQRAPQVSEHLTFNSSPLVTSRKDTAGVLGGDSKMTDSSAAEKIKRM